MFLWTTQRDLVWVSLTTFAAKLHATTNHSFFLLMYLQVAAGICVLVFSKPCWFLVCCFFQEKLLHRNNDFHTTEDTRGITQRAKRSPGKQPDTGMSSIPLLSLLVHFKLCNKISYVVVTMVTLWWRSRCSPIAPSLHGPCAALHIWPLLSWLFARRRGSTWLTWTVWVSPPHHSCKQSWITHGFVGLVIEQRLLSLKTCWGIKRVCFWDSA